VIRPLRWAGHPLLWLHRRHPWWFTALSTAFVVAVALLIDLSTNGKLDQSFRIVTVALGWCAGILAATFANRTQAPGSDDEWMNELPPGNANVMTADSDDVAETANRKPKGSLTQIPTAVPSRAATEASTTREQKHLTGERQAAENRANESPA